MKWKRSWNVEIESGDFFFSIIGYGYPILNDVIKRNLIEQNVDAGGVILKSNFAAVARSLHVEGS